MNTQTPNIQNTLEHYQGLSHELRTGEVHRCGLCSPIHAICETCKVEIKSTWGAARVAGWVEIEGNDYCERCSPYRVKEAA